MPEVVVLEPLTLFVYTWRFLITLEQEAESKTAKFCYRWFARISICTLPVGFYAVFAAVCIEYGMFWGHFFKKEV